MFWILSGIAAIPVLGSLFVSWGPHLEMTRNESPKWAWGTFSEFLTQFEKLVWERDKAYPESFFSVERNDKRVHRGYIHASILRFNGVGMCLDPISWARFCLWARARRYPSASKQISVNWKEV